MILADKIIENRKKNGWSQEELAERLDVSRQSVSKWEMAQAVPDMKKIIQLSELFGVSTDYLLKDDIETVSYDEMPVNERFDEQTRSVSLPEANEFLEHNRKASFMIATGVMLCILSPVTMIILEELSVARKITMPVSLAETIGGAVLLMMIAVAVGMFVSIGIAGKRFDYLEEVQIETQYGVSGHVRQLRSDYAPTHSRMLVIGIMLCIVAALPMMIFGMMEDGRADTLMMLGTAFLLLMISVGTWLIVKTCIVEEGFEKLLEEGDYHRLDKKAGRYDGIFWGLATAIYLGWSFITMKWHITWIVWPIAGVLYAVYRQIIKVIIGR